jgi:carboxyl-terminal processing protease
MLWKRKFLMWVFFSTLIITALAIAGTWSLADVSTGTEEYKELKVFTEVLSYVKRSYVEEPSTKDLVYNAIKGMLSSLDPHSGFMTQEAYKEMQVDTKGEFGGLGIQIGMKDGILTVIAPIEDTPAFKAGIKAMDRIIKINGEPTKDMALHEAVGKMRGPKGTDVTITIMREGWKETKDFKITRDIIQIKSVKARLIDDEIGYVKITQFQEKTGEELSSALNEIGVEKMKSIILDLRNNPGGLLNSAVDVSSRFLDAGKLVVYIKDRAGEKNEYRTYAGDSAYKEQPMIVLVNQGSASASEIVAGCLKDWNRAVVLGLQTFGKGSVQSVIPLSDGSAIRLTTARYYTPRGTTIQTTGIKPDIEVKLEAKNGEKEHPVIREKDLKGHLENEREGDMKKGTETEETAPMGVSEEDDTQLRRAVELLKTWRVFKELPAAS